MFGISFSEILLILVISLLIFGPEQLPQIAAKLGKAIATFRNFSTNLRQQVYEQTGIAEFENLREEVRDTINKLQQQINPLSVDNHNDFINEDQLLYQEYHYLYQPELDFDRQPELFDE